MLIDSDRGGVSLDATASECLSGKIKLIKNLIRHSRSAQNTALLHSPLLQFISPGQNPFFQTANQDMQLDLKLLLETPCDNI